MSVLRRSSVSDFTRGGQTTLHFLRMVGQVFSKFGMFLAFCMLCIWGWYFYQNTTSFQRMTTLNWLVAKGATDYMHLGEDEMSFVLESGRTIQVKRSRLAQDEGVTAIAGQSLRVVWLGAIYAVAIVLLCFSGVVLLIYKTGKSLREEEVIRGGEMMDGKQLSKLLKADKIAGDFSIGNVVLPKNSEVKHILFTGSHGSGKSLGIKELLAKIRSKGQRAIVFSTSTEFIEAFYREGKDTILNPLDMRCPSWDVWCEGRTPSDFDNIAASLIPEPTAGQDPFWALAARTLFSTLSMRMFRLGELSTPKLLRDLLTIDLDEAAKLVEGTEGGALISEGAEKTALSVRATLSTYIRSLKFLRHEGKKFSIHDWVLDEDGDGWIFITANAKQLETLRPLITSWLDIACSSILSLPENPDRRIWLTIDELPALNKLPMLDNFLAQSRKYGGCAILGFQSIAQLRGRYGRDTSDSILGLCGAWMIYRANEPSMAKLASEKIGESEVMEPSEGLSYGANEIRDGVTLSLQRKTRPLVMSTEIMGLPDLRGYACLGSGTPVCTFELKYKKYKKIAQGYIEGEDSFTSWDFSLQAEEDELAYKKKANRVDEAQDPTISGEDSVVKESDSDAPSPATSAPHAAPVVADDMFTRLD